MRAEKFSFPLVCSLVIELFIVALILVDCFVSLLFHHYHMYFAIVISSEVIGSSLEKIFYIFFKNLPHEASGKHIREVCQMSTVIIGHLLNRY